MTKDSIITNISRIPAKHNRTLRAWNAGDEYLLNYANDSSASTITLYHDRFGFLGCNLQERTPEFVVERKSQLDALETNLKNNELGDIRTRTVLESGQSFDLALCFIPKSLERFELYLQDAVRHATDKSILLCAFMTKHFTKSWLALAGKYFGKVEQSLAVKKSRLLILSEPINSESVQPPTSTDIDLDGFTGQRFPGTFAGNKVDMATRFLLDNLPEFDNAKRVLDLGSGNGIIANTMKSKAAEEIHLVEDDYLSYESGKSNCSDSIYHHHWDYSLNNLDIQDFDVVVTNPPFHHGYEQDIEMAFNLFKEAHNILRSGGTLLIVANRHLNYRTQLSRYFSRVEVIKQNDKFEIIEATK